MRVFDCRRCAKCGWKCGPPLSHCIASSCFGHIRPLNGRAAAGRAHGAVREQGVSRQAAQGRREGLSMVVLLVRRSLHIIALALSFVAFAASVSPASARSRHHAGHHAHRSHGGHHARHHVRHVRSYARISRWDRRVARLQVRGLDDAQASLMSPGTGAGVMGTSSGFGDSSVVAEARRYLGGNPTSRSSLWCARFMNMVLERTGHHGTGSDLARRSRAMVSAFRGRRSAPSRS